MSKNAVIDFTFHSDRDRFVLVFSFTILLSSLFLASNSHSDQSPSAPASIKAFDTPNDDGSSITVEWELSADDGAGEDDVVAYVILRSSVAVGDVEEVERVRAGLISSGMGDFPHKQFTDDEVTRGRSYYYIVQACDRAGNVANSRMIGPVIPTAQWLDREQIPTALAITLFSGIVIYCIYHAKSGRKPFIRRIPGLEAIDEAIGRATEMGKSALYISGIADIKNIATIASMNVLARVARMAAEYDIPLLVPCSEPVVMNIGREVVQNAHLDAGRPDTYRQENIFFITEGQFAYAAAVDGIIMRERPAAIFYMGAFMAESLILAEVGDSVGAVQVAGTDSITQLPFFITACDYTLMGEELYAASAYLSKEPMLLGSLKGQDWGKLIAIASILVGVVLRVFNLNWFNWFIGLFRI